MLLAEYVSLTKHESIRDYKALEIHDTLSHLVEYSLGESDRDDRVMQYCCDAQVHHIRQGQH